MPNNTSNFINLGLGALLVATIGTLTFNQVTRETYIPNPAGDNTQIVGDGEIIVNSTGSGGRTNYDTFIVQNPMTTTGSINLIQIEVKTSNTTLGLDCSFQKNISTATGTALHANFNNWQAGTGRVLKFSTGSLRWNPADYIKCATLRTLPSNFNGILRVRYFDDTSS